MASSGASESQQRGPYSSPLDIITDEFGKSGMQVEFLRKTSGGDLVPASHKELGVLGVKSKVATHSQLLSNATSEEKLEWALEMKDYANGLYGEKRYEEAMDKYVEALAASEFGGKSRQGCSSSDAPSNGDNLDISVEDTEDGDWAVVDRPSKKKTGVSNGKSDTSGYDEGNVDTLVMPVLTNLCACCIQLKLFGKAIAFADQALQLRPQHCKALMRRGVAYLHSGEYRGALADFDMALKLTSNAVIPNYGNSSSSSGGAKAGNSGLSETDIERIKIFMIKARSGKQADRANEQKVRKKVEESFKKRAYINDFSATRKPNAGPRDVPVGKEEERGKRGGFGFDLKVVLASIVVALLALYYIYF